MFNDECPRVSQTSIGLGRSRSAACRPSRHRVPTFRYPLPRGTTEPAAAPSFSETCPGWARRIRTTLVTARLPPSHVGQGRVSASATAWSLVARRLSTACQRMSARARSSARFLGELAPPRANSVRQVAQGWPHISPAAQSQCSCDPVHLGHAFRKSERSSNMS